MNSLVNVGRGLAGAMLLTAALSGVAGCDNKETVLEIETPDTEIEVERDKGTGAVDVEVEEN